MGKILDDPKDFFDNLIDEEFLKLLDEFGFDYELKGNKNKEE